MRVRKKNQSLRKYNRINTISSIIWVLAGIAIIGFGIYYREIFEKIFGAVAIAYGIISFKGRKKPTAIKKYEQSRLFILSLLLVIYSLVNPLGNIAILFDLYKREYIVRGGLSE